MSRRSLASGRLKGSCSPLGEAADLDGEGEGDLAATTARSARLAFDFDLFLVDAEDEDDASDEACR